MRRWIRSTVGGEAWLALCVMLVSLPVVGTLTYMIWYAAISNASQLAILLAGMGVWWLIISLMEKWLRISGRRSKMAIDAIFYAAGVGCWGITIVRLWSDSGFAAAMKLLLATLFIASVIEVAKRRADRIKYGRG